MTLIIKHVSTLLRFNLDSFVFLHRKPDCIFLHFEQGLNFKRFQELDLEGEHGGYVMTQFIQYKRNPDHFICWTSDPGGTTLLNPCLTLRLLPTFTDAIQEKNCTCASFNKIPTNYISVESLMYFTKQNAILAMFSFSMCQEAVRPDTTQDSSIEFIGYRILQHEQNDCTVLFTRHKSTKVCQAFSIF